MFKLIGLGFDGFSTISGNENGVQPIIKKKYLTVGFFHCASHMLNLIVNDQNSIPEIRKTTETVKKLYIFFLKIFLRKRHP